MYASSIFKATEFPPQGLYHLAKQLAGGPFGIDFDQVSVVLGEGTRRSHIHLANELLSTTQLNPPVDRIVIDGGTAGTGERRWIEVQALPAGCIRVLARERDLERATAALELAVGALELELLEP